MTAKRITHRTYANWSIDALLAEHDRLNIPRQLLEGYLDAHGAKTGRWCMVQMLVDVQSDRAPYPQIKAGDWVRVEYQRGSDHFTAEGILVADCEGTPRLDDPKNVNGYGDIAQVAVFRNDLGYLPWGVVLISHKAR